MDRFEIFEQLKNLDLKYAVRINEILEGKQEKSELDDFLRSEGIVEINNNHTNLKDEYIKVLNSSLRDILSGRRKRY